MSEPLETRRLLAATLLADINVTPEGQPTRSSSTADPSTAPVVVNGRAVFPAKVGPLNQESVDLWSTDGTSAGTTRLADLDRIGAIVDFGDSALVLANAATLAGNLWRTGGTPATTVKVTDVAYETLNGPTVDSVARLNGVIYFSGDTTSFTTRRGFELYRSDGTAAGTYRVKDIAVQSPSASSSPRSLTTVGNRVFFTARGTTTGNELWVSDGTEAGTVLLKSFLAVAGQSRRAENFVDLGGTLLFRATGPNNEAEIWKSDGTPQGTLLVRRFAPYSGLPGGTPLVRAGGFVYFVAAEPETRFNNELWKTDGTDGGTARVKDINPGTDFASNPEHLLAAGNRVYFSAFDRTAGAELWVSDGTETGTTRVADVRFDFGSSGAIPWTAVGNRVYFTADDGATGRELYSTDGTPAGTALVDDVNPGPIGSGARWPTAVGGNIVFWADDGIHGAEPMAAPLAGTPPAAVVGRHVFYNDSAFDGSNPAPNAADDGALATDKTALRPGQAASFANVTGYTRGINGLMIDFSGDLPLTALAGIAASLELKAGAAGDPSQWPDAPGPSQITIRKGAGVGGSDRVTLVWYDGSIRNAWLRVTVRALPPSGLSADDTFTFGNLVGETGDAGANLTVSARDVLDTRLNRSPAAVGTGNRFDHNRDGSVNVLDYTAALRNIGRSIAWSPPPQAAGAVPPARPRTAPVRRSVLEAVPADPR